MQQRQHHLMLEFAQSIPSHLASLRSSTRRRKPAPAFLTMQVSVFLQNR